MEQICLTACEEDEGKRVDLFVSEETDGLSRSRLQKLIEDRELLVNLKPVKPSYKIRKNDFITVNISEPEETEILPENIALAVLYEDKDLIVIDKPKGMVVHPAAGHYSGTLVNALLYHCGEGLSGINGVLRPGIVHRIDKDTSGVLVAAKSDFAHAALSRCLAEHSMTRVYKALCFGVINRDELTVDLPIGRSKSDRKKMAVVTSGGKNAFTTVKVTERFRTYTYAEARLKTGRTHQIRVHMAHIGHPLVGDEVYGRSKQPFITQGQMLHAAVLGFVHPASGQYMEFEAPIPEYFSEILAKLRKK